MDDIDRAQARQAADIELALAEHARRQRPGRDTCAECLDPIPPARQALGVYRCFDCQAEIEARDRTRRR